MAVMSEVVARERLKRGRGARPGPVYTTRPAIARAAHIVIAPLDLGRYHWRAGFPSALQTAGVVGVHFGTGMNVWALRHNECHSARIRMQSERGNLVVSTGPYEQIRHPNHALPPAIAFARPLPVRTLEQVWQIGKEAGLEFVYTGNLPGHRVENTYCPGCGTLLIRRWGFDMRLNALHHGNCPRCGRGVADVWGSETQ
jgi:hypothetical protein